MRAVAGMSAGAVANVNQLRLEAELDRLRMENQQAQSRAAMAEVVANTLQQQRVTNPIFITSQVLGQAPPPPPPAPAPVPVQPHPESVRQAVEAVLAGRNMAQAQEAQAASVSQIVAEAQAVAKPKVREIVKMLDKKTAPKKAAGGATAPMPVKEAPAYAPASAPPAPMPAPAPVPAPKAAAPAPAPKADAPAAATAAVVPAAAALRGIKRQKASGMDLEDIYFFERGRTNPARRLYRQTVKEARPLTAGPSPFPGERKRKNEGDDGPMRQPPNPSIAAAPKREEARAMAKRALDAMREEQISRNRSEASELLQLLRKQTIPKTSELKRSATDEYVMNLARIGFGFSDINLTKRRRSGEDYVSLIR